MLVPRSIFARARLAAVALTAGLACGVLSPPGALAAGHGRGLSLRVADAQGTGGSSSQPVIEATSHTSVALESCIAATTSASGAETAGEATFAARMSAVPDAAQMEMRFEILERVSGEAAFRRPPGAGSAALGSWRESALHVAVFKDSDEVTGLFGPAQYSARVHFRWLDAEGHTIAWAERRAEACKQPSPATS